MLQEGFPVEVVEVPHPLPETVKCAVPLRSLAVGLERDISRSVHSHHGVKVLFAGIRLVSRHFVNLECLSRCLYQSGKLGGIGSLGRGSLNAGDDVGFDPADKVRLNPSLLAALFAVLVVEPSGIGAGGKARRVNGEVGLHRPQRASALLNEAFQQGCQFGTLQVAEGAGEGRGLGDQPSGFRFPQVGHKASAGHGGIDLSGDAEHDIGQRQPRSPEPVFWLFNAVAEVSEQGDKVFLFVGLGFVVGSPLLGAGYFNRLGVGSSAVWLCLPLDYELNGVDMLARQSSLLKVGAGAERLAVVKAHDISPVARLGGDFPAQFVLLNLACVGYHQPSLFSLVHFNTPYFNPLFCIYNSTHCVSLSILFGGILMNFLKIVFLNHIDNATHCVVYSHQVNNDEVQAKLAELQQKGWTLANIARRIGQAKRTVESWNQGQRSPANLQSVLASLDKLDKVKRIPKKKIYIK
jgi:hypothetical protein